MMAELVKGVKGGITMWMTVQWTVCLLIGEHWAWNLFASNDSDDSDFGGFQGNWKEGDFIRCVTRLSRQIYYFIYMMTAIQKV